MKQLKKIVKKYRLSSVGYVYLLSGLVFLATIFLIGYFGAGFLKDKGGDETREEGSVIVETPIRCDHRRILDGVCVDADKTNPKVYAVMIENHFEAWPQSGLADASVVYEATVEGNITRFLAVFPEGKEIAQIGPVRSARPYYLDWVMEYGTPVYVHVGGSDEALQTVRTGEVFDLDEFNRGWYFWRRADRYAPHNAYTSSKLVEKAIADYAVQYTDTDYPGWSFGPMDPCTGTCVTSLSASFYPPTYKATWNYVSSTQKYERYQVGDHHRDEDGRVIMADTVIAQHVKNTVIDTVGRKRVTTVGSGKATVYRQGHAISGTWKKDAKTGRTQWYDETGKEIPLNPGNIWIEVIAQDNTLTSVESTL